MKAIGLCSAFNRMSKSKAQSDCFWLRLEKKVQLIRVFLNIPLCLTAVDLQIVAYWESQTLWSVPLSVWMGGVFPADGIWAPLEQCHCKWGQFPGKCLVPSYISVSRRERKRARISGIRRSSRRGVFHVTCCWWTSPFQLSLKINFQSL